MNRINENMKLDNFRYRLGVLQHTLDSYSKKYLDTNKFFHNVFTPKWIYESENEFVKVILSELDPQVNENRLSAEIITSALAIAMSSIDSNNKNKKNLNDNISSDDISPYILGNKECIIYSKTIKMDPVISSSSYNQKVTSLSSSYAVERYKLIFWLIVVILLDSHLYNTYLDYVVDLADIFGFTEYMINDWCEAAIYWLNGNDINPQCGLNLKTEEGNRFFLNK